MSFLKQIQFSETNVPKIGVGLLIFILAFGLFIVGYDQGQLFSLVQGEQSYNDLWVHEFSHDMRHTAGFPCHQIHTFVIMMDSLSFLVFTLISGAIAGTIFGLINLAIVEPYLDRAI